MGQTHTEPLSARPPARREGEDRQRGLQKRGQRIIGKIARKRRNGTITRGRAGREARATAGPGIPQHTTKGRRRELSPTAFHCNTWNPLLLILEFGLDIVHGHQCTEIHSITDPDNVRGQVIGSDTFDYVILNSHV